MAIDDRFSSSKPGEFARGDITEGTKIDAGPFIGKVKNNIDPAKLGRIQVYIPELSSGNEDDPQNWRIVTYSSPYFGMTSPAVAGNEANLYGTTKESYGMWMTAPDLGVLVLCVFVGGDPNRGYYIGCLPDGTSHYMVPGLAGSSKFDPNVLTQEQIQRADGATVLPVTEFNDLNQDLVTHANLTEAARPVHDLQFQNFVRQGLISDNTRGVISSSSMRESPSSVFGVSTPGRKVAFNQDDPSEVWMRQGGHSIVMDDGDANNKDNMIRLRTSAGNQIMMNDSAGIIYVISSSGRNWIEMGADGSIRAYSQSDISLHADGEINFHSESAINMQAPVINLKAGDKVNVNAATDINIMAEKNITQVAGLTYGIKSTTTNIVGNSTNISVEKNLILNGDKIYLNTLPHATVKTPTPIVDIGIVPTQEPWKRPDGTVGTDTDDGLASTPAEAKTAPKIIPKTAVPTTGVDATKKKFTAKQNAKGIAEILTTQPTPATGIGILSRDQVKVLFAGVAQSESGGSYTVVNSIGYSGKYQFGVAALEDLGYIKKGTWAAYGKNSIMSNNSVWTGKNGINSRDDFLNSKNIQEDVMFQNSERNYNTLVRIGGIRAGDTPDVVAGMLKTAHLLGAGGARNWRQGKGGSDAYGTTGDQYFAQGQDVINKYAQGGTLQT